MAESKHNTTLNQYLREKRMYCYYELKVPKGKSFAFSKIETNQNEGLHALQKEGLVWKLSDEDSRKKPCDGFCTPPLPAFLVIKFGDKFYFIHHEDILHLMEIGTKSIDEKHASGLAVKIVSLSTG